MRSTDTVQRQNKFVEKSELYPKRNLNLVVDKLNRIVKKLKDSEAQSDGFHMFSEAEPQEDIYNFKNEYGYF